MDFYKFPVSFDQITKGEKWEKVSEKESIKEHIYLILMTSLNDSRYDMSYGCKIWERDFDISTDRTDYKTEVEESLAESIEKHEKRIFPDFRVEVQETKIKEIINETDIRRQQKSFMVKVKNIRMKNTNLPLDEIEYSIIFSPISLG